MRIMGFELVDEGTMDTVLECDCNARMRYNDVDRTIEGWLLNLIEQADKDHSGECPLFQMPSKTFLDSLTD